MKTLHSILVLGALSVLPAAAIAQTSSDLDTVTVSGIGVPKHPYPMTPEEFYKFKGSYDLSNGGTLSLFNRNHIMYAKLGGQEWHRIVATAPNSFVATDHLLKVRLEPREDGDMGGELLLARR